ncbi:MAG: hypothetical protein H6837_07175 [Planctomycetes bacterium]|nr:hypothetical protein [Planctomycetota bacterium]
MRLLLLLVTVASAAAALWCHSEMRRVQGRAAALERLRAAPPPTPRSGVPAPAVSEPSPELRAAREQVRRLEGELAAEIARRKAVNAHIDQIAADLRAERERHNKEVWQAKKFMPEGVRQALLAANECLRAEGHYDLRFLHARSIDDLTLCDVELLDHDPGALSSELYLAGKMTFELDREKGTLTLRCKEGFRRSREGRAKFPAEGECLVLREIDGRLWERRLPALIRARGEYPAVLASAPRAAPMAPTLRAAWRDRLNALLAAAGTKTRYRISAFRTLQDTRFREALLLGYDAGKILSMSVEAERLWVEVDAAAASVSLVMAGGLLRQTGGDAKLPESGYRIRLGGVKPEQAVEAMLGMVVRR